MFNSGNRGQGGRGDKRRQGRGMGAGNIPGSGPTGYCVCPKCGHKVEHQVGQRCMDLTCPECNTRMIRE